MKHFMRNVFGIWAAAVLVGLMGPAACGDGGSEEDADQEDLAVEDPGPEEAPDQEDAQEGDPVEDAEEEEAPQAGRLGDPCAVPADCESEVCITALLFPGFEDGYCTMLDCDPAVEGSCGPDGVCVDLGSGSFPAVCARSCESADDCAEGQDCAGVCVPPDFVSEPTLPDLIDPDDSVIGGIVSAMSEDGMRLWLEILSGARAWESPEGPVTITSRSVYHADHGPAVDFLEAELTNMGLSAVRLEFDLETDHFINLEARLAGADPDLDPVFVTAHYDSTASRTEGWYPITDPAPGASDNGSGVIIALEIARLLTLAAATDPPARDVVFVLFDGEELGLLGSEQYVADLVAAAGRVLCVINVDMVGWSPPATPDRYWYTYDGADEATAAFGLEAIYDFVPEAVPIPSSLELFASSDHASFWGGGFCAASMSGFPPAPQYHTTGDVIEAVDWPYLMAAARSAAAVTAAWAYRWSD
jgi:hypothetical protein